MNKIISKISALRTKIISFASIIIVLAGLVNLFFIFNVTAVSNDECIWVPVEDKDSIKILFDFVKFEGAAWNAGIRDGDRLLSINDISVINAAQAQVIINSVSEGNYAVYEFQRNNITYERKVFLKKLIDFQVLGLILLGLLWIIVAQLVYISKPEGYTQNLFYLVALSANLVSFTGFLKGDIGINPLLSSEIMKCIIEILSLSGIIFGPYLLLHFFLRFPLLYSFASFRKFKYRFYSIPFILFVFGITILLFKDSVIAFDSIYRTYYNPVLFSGFIICLAASLFVLIKSYRKLEKKNEKRAVRLIFLSLVSGIMILIYSAFIVREIAGVIFNDPIYYTPIIFIFIVPFAFGIAIFRYSLLDFSEVIRNSIIYITATILIAIIYFGLIYLIGESLSSLFFDEYKVFAAAAIFVIFSFVFQSAKNKYQEILTEKFFPEQFAYQRLLLKFNNEIVLKVGLTSIIEFSAETLVNALKIKHFVMIIKNEEKNCYEVLKEYGFISETVCFRINETRFWELCKGLIKVKGNAAFERGEFSNVFINNYSELEANKIHTIIPLMVKESLIGFLGFGLKYSGSKFGGKDIELLNAAANQIAVSIENARLYKSEGEKLAIERELDNARKIQQALLPAKTAEFNSVDVKGIMIPASQVGGDYYDILKKDEDNFLILVADVSGKGLSASLYMSQIAAIIKIISGLEKSVKNILIKLNERLIETLEKKYFVTMSIASVNTKTREITLCRAGHLQIIEISKEGEIKLHRPGGIGLGLNGGDIFKESLEEVKIKADSGSVFAFFTDGITEAANEEDVLFGIQTASEVLSQCRNSSSEEIVNRLIASVEHFRGGREQSDDITSVIMKFI